MLLLLLLLFLKWHNRPVVTPGPLPRENDILLYFLSSINISSHLPDRDAPPGHRVLSAVIILDNLWTWLLRDYHRKFFLDNSLEWPTRLIHHTLPFLMQGTLWISVSLYCLLSSSFLRILHALTIHVISKSQVCSHY